MNPSSRRRSDHFWTRGIVCASAVAWLALASGLPREASAETRTDAPQEIRPTFAHLEGGENAQKTYDLNTLDVIHVESTSVGTFWDTTTTWWRPTRGVYRRGMTYSEFYGLLGRLDLAKQASNRHAIGAALFWGGVAAMVGGAVLGIYELEKKRDAGALVGAGLLVGGYITLSVGSALTGPALSEPVAQDMAARYNRALGQRLGLSAGGTF